MFLNLLAVLGGLGLLVWSSDRFVIGAAATARRFRISPLIIGMVVVGFGTSAPEMLVSGTAAVTGNPTLGVGNALGSNIANIGLVIGATALISPLMVKGSIVKREFMVLMAVTATAMALVLPDAHLSREDGLVLSVCLLLALMALAWLSEAPHSAEDEADYDEHADQNPNPDKAVASLLLGLIGLLLASRILVWGAVGIAQAAGISDLVIGLTIVAVGTSLPELAAGIASALKREHELAVGNIIGSNIFNTAAVMGIPALIAPTAVGAEVVQRDLPIVAGLTLLLLLFSLGRNGPGVIARFKGGLLLACFAGYQLLLFAQTSG